MPAPKRPAVTIRHVAAEAGVSLQTVSRVINNGPNVREAVKARVEEVVARLGYVPNRAAQRLGGSRSYLILALNDRDRTIADWRERLGVDWVDQMLLGGMLKCAEYGYRMMFELVDTHNDHVERELMATIAALQPDGVILTPPHSDNPLIINLLASQNIIFARIGSDGSGPGITLTMDDERAARLATEHLVGLGHRRIGFIAGPDEYSLSGWRVAGWSAAMASAGLSIDGLRADGDFSYESGTSAVDRLLALSDPPTAIIASNDQMALAALAGIKRKGLAVPEDISLISFDNTPVVKFAQPSLTAIDQPIAEVSSKAVELIIAAQRGEPLPPQPAIVPSSLVERQSTARRRGA